MNKQVMVAALVVLLMGALVFETVEASRIAQAAKLYFLVRAFRNKKIFLPVPLPLPIPLFKENVHHKSVPVHTHTKAVVGYGLEQGHGGGGGHGWH